jgi:putative transposase
VVDYFSRFILGWDLDTNMTGSFLEDVVQQAVGFTNMTYVLVEDQSVLLSDNSAGYITKQFNQYLRPVGIRHITASLFHPQTNGKIERYQRTLKVEIKQVPYDMLRELKEAIRAFIDYYNYRCYHEGLGNVTPYDVYMGGHLEIIRKRKEIESRKLSARKVHNRTARGQEQDL